MAKIENVSFGVDRERGKPVMAWVKFLVDGQKKSRGVAAPGFAKMSDAQVLAEAKEVLVYLLKEQRGDYADLDAGF